MDSRQPYDDKCPPPIYLDNETLMKPLPISKADILQGLEEREFGGLVCTDEEALERQKGVLVDVLK